MAETYWTTPVTPSSERIRSIIDIDAEIAAFMTGLVQAVWQGRAWTEAEEAFVQLLASCAEGVPEEPYVVRADNRALSRSVAASAPDWAREGGTIDPRWVHAIAAREEAASSREAPERLTEAALRTCAEEALGRRS